MGQVRLGLNRVPAFVLFATMRSLLVTDPLTPDTKQFGGDKGQLWPRIPPSLLPSLPPCSTLSETLLSHSLRLHSVA